MGVEKRLHNFSTTGLNETLHGRITMNPKTNQTENHKPVIVMGKQNLIPPAFIIQLKQRWPPTWWVIRELAKGCELWTQSDQPLPHLDRLHTTADSSGNPRWSFERYRSKFEPIRFISEQFVFTLELCGNVQFHSRGYQAVKSDWLVKGLNPLLCRSFHFITDQMIRKAEYNITIVKHTKSYHTVRETQQYVGLNT